MREATFFYIVRMAAKRHSAHTNGRSVRVHTKHTGFIR